MPLFLFHARNVSGEETSGEREAADQYALARALRAEGLLVISVQAVINKGAKSLREYLPAMLHPIKLEEKMNFTRNIAVMIGAGLSLTKALDVMSRQTTNSRFRLTILAIAETIQKGKSFADALGDHAGIFPKFYQEMVRAGEKSGNLQDSLKHIALQLQKDHALMRKVKSAFIYPGIIVVAMIGVGVLMLIYVVPTLISTFEDLDVELPASTRFIIVISESLLQSGFIFLGAVVIIAMLLWRALQTTRGNNIVDWMFFHAPVLGSINQKLNAARTCRTLSSLISSGVNILEAIDITKGILQNHIFREVLQIAQVRIQKGETLSSAFLDKKKVYPLLVGEMIAVGEETGELSGMLLRLAQFYESEVGALTKDLSTIIEPVLMIIIGAVVGFFAIAMISPMYNLVSGF